MPRRGRRDTHAPECLGTLSVSCPARAVDGTPLHRCLGLLRKLGCKDKALVPDVIATPLFPPTCPAGPRASRQSAASTSPSSVDASPSLPTRPGARAAQGCELQLADLAGILLASLLIFAVPLINARHRIFWEDETLGWVLLRDPSWRHMLRAWNLGADGGGIMFYLLGRGWFHLFGDGVLAFRLFSATGFSLAIPVLWSALRRFYSTPVVAFAVLNTFFFSPPLTLHYMEGRFYGLLMLGTALAFWLALAVDAGVDRPSWKTYLAILTSHLLLTGCHVLGVLYSAVMVLAMVLLDRARRRWRPGLYAAACSSWLVLLFERTALHATAAVGKPHFWTTAPKPAQVLGAFAGYSPEILVLLFLLSLGALAVLPRTWAGIRVVLRNGPARRLPLAIVCGCLFLVPAALLLEGSVGTWLFTDRYLQPLALGIAALTAELTSLMARQLLGGLPLSRSSAHARGLALTGAAGFLLFLLFWVFRHEAHYTPSVPDFTASLSARMPSDAPIVVEDAFTFTELMSRPASARYPYVFLLDWSYASGSRAPRMEVTQFHLMQNWQRSGYFAEHIQNRQEFLRAHTHFYILNNSILGPKPAERPESGNPLAKDFTTSGRYRTRQLWHFDRTRADNQRDTLWQIDELSAIAASPGS